MSDEISTRDSIQQIMEHIFYALLVIPTQDFERFVNLHRDYERMTDRPYPDPSGDLAIAKHQLRVVEKLLEVRKLMDSEKGKSDNE